jgi:EAL domain-containing protein (putative c-di-GMP-specific phosphodiesterase class I)/GGDEF domain-containing protein
MTFSTAAQVLSAQALQAHFQPIVRLKDGAILSSEGLIRGPQGSALHLPDALFAAAAREGLTIETEIAAAVCSLRSWAEQAPHGKLFLNFSAAALSHLLGDDAAQQRMLLTLRQLNLSMSSLVIEVTEHERVSDLPALIERLVPWRAAGVQIALDDFGDGRSSLRLWAELRPDYVKLDKYFSKNITRHPDKVQTVRALLRIAETFDTHIVAEGLETEDELKALRDLGVEFGQGYFLGRPGPRAANSAPASALAVLRSSEIAVLPEQARSARADFTVGRLVQAVPTLHPSATHDTAAQLFMRDEALRTIVVIDTERHPVALLNRDKFIDRYARPYFKEVYGRQSCMLFANTSPLVLDQHTGLDALTSVLTSADQRYLADGFVITEAGRYLGVGTGEQLVRTVTEVRIEAARHANPLTFLPGNIPITQHIDRLLKAGTQFVACYGDLNHFKPFNDRYGYWRGDEMIRLAARAVLSHCDERRDFVGHVGGDDFVMLFQSIDWRERCERIVATFNEMAQALFDDGARAAGGFEAEDRQGGMQFFPLTSLSIGAVPVCPPDRHGGCAQACGAFDEAEQVASAAAAAKLKAKQGRLGLYVAAGSDLPSSGQSAMPADDAGLTLGHLLGNRDCAIQVPQASQVVKVTPAAPREPTGLTGLPVFQFAMMGF